MAEHPVPSAHDPLARLVPHEQRVLAHWLSAAACCSIDAVLDLADRPWLPYPVDVVLGVYRDGAAEACWLIVGHQGQWAVACCAKQTVSGSYRSLAEALQAVQPAAV